MIFSNLTVSERKSLIEGDWSKHPPPDKEPRKRRWAELEEEYYLEYHPSHGGNFTGMLFDKLLELETEIALKTPPVEDKPHGAIITKQEWEETFSEFVRRAVDLSDKNQCKVKAIGRRITLEIPAPRHRPKHPVVECIAPASRQYYNNEPLTPGDPWYVDSGLGDVIPVEVAVVDPDVVVVTTVGWFYNPPKMFTYPRGLLDRSLFKLVPTQ